MAARLSDAPSARAARAQAEGDVDTLLALLRGTARRGRISAAVKLGEMGERRAVGPLVRALQASDELMRMAALRALGQIGDPSVADAVAAIGAEDPSPAVRSSAATALSALSDSRAVGVLVSILEADTTAHTRRWAASELTRLGAVDAASAIDDAARRSSPIARWRLRRQARKLRSNRS